MHIYIHAYILSLIIFSIFVTMSDSQPSQTECKRKFEDSPTGILASRDRNLHETDAGALKEKIKRVFQFNNSSRVIPETPENT